MRLGWYDCSGISNPDRVEGLHLFFDEEEGRNLARFGWVNLPGAEILINELVCGFPFLDREGVEFSYFWDEGFI